MNMHTVNIKKEKIITTTLELREVLNTISFRNSVINFDWKFCFSEFSMNVQRGIDAGHRRGWLVWAEFTRPDIETGKIGTGRGRDEIIYEGATESAVVKTAWLVVELLVRHELMETFSYENRVIFNPHHTVGHLGAAATIFDSESENLNV